MSKSAKSEFPETDNSKVTARVDSVRRYRRKWRRIDYYPAPDALKVIDRIRETNPKHTIGQLLDFLVLQAAKATSGNNQR